MKKLGKLSINLNKVMKNEELVNLRGGYGYNGYDFFVCKLRDRDNNIIEISGLSAYSKPEAEAALLREYSWAVSANCNLLA